MANLSKFSRTSLFTAIVIAGAATFAQAPDVFASDGPATTAQTTPTPTSAQITGSEDNGHFTSVVTVRKLQPDGTVKIDTYRQSGNSADIEDAQVQHTSSTVASAPVEQMTVVQEVPAEISIVRPRINPVYESQLQLSQNVGAYYLNLTNNMDLSWRQRREIHGLALATSEAEWDVYQKFNTTPAKQSDLSMIKRWKFNHAMNNVQGQVKDELKNILTVSQYDQAKKFMKKNDLNHA